MAGTAEVSAIIPTFNRRELVVRAIDSVLAQTRRVEEIIVVDDGSTDGTQSALRDRYGDRIRYAWQENAGVSSARNRGMAMASGRYLALLDSDDEWLPEKNALQVGWLERHPDYGMVLCDVQRIDGERRDIDVLSRRAIIREDGWILRWIIHDPMLVPASVLMRREVFEKTGGFDESLKTAEDLEYHLRIAREWRIGLVEAPLVRAMRGHEGLSATANTYDDYVRVMEHALSGAAGMVAESERRRALVGAYTRNARGMIMRERWRDAWELARKAWRIAPDPGSFLRIAGLASFGARRATRRAIGTRVRPG